MGQYRASSTYNPQHYINESEEADDVGTHTMRKRTLKSNRKKKERANRADPKRTRSLLYAWCMLTDLVYHGDRARFHYYQCLQLLFRKQVSALTALWNLPSEFEVCRLLRVAGIMSMFIVSDDLQRLVGVPSQSHSESATSRTFSLHLGAGRGSTRTRGGWKEGQRPIKTRE